MNKLLQLQLQPQKWSYEKKCQLRSWVLGGVVTAHTYMVMDYSSSIYTDSTWHSGNNLHAAWQYRKDIPNCCITPVCLHFDP